jgi:hypothetical protein
MYGFSSTKIRERLGSNNKPFKFIKTSINTGAETRLKKYIEKKYGKIK